MRIQLSAVVRHSNDFVNPATTVPNCDAKKRGFFKAKKTQIVGFFIAQ